MLRSSESKSPSSPRQSPAELPEQTPRSDERALRVLHVIPAIASRYGGPSANALATCRLLAAHGVDTLLATTSADGSGELDVPIASITDFAGVPTILFQRQWSESFKLSIPLARWLRNNTSGFDLVHIHAFFSHSCQAAASAARRVGVPYILRPLGSLSSWSMARSSWRKRVFLLVAGRRMIRESAAVQFTSGAELEQAHALIGNTRSVVIPLAVEQVGSSRTDSRPLEERFPEISGRPFILVLSRLDRKKGLDLLIRAFAQAKNRLTTQDWRLVIAGDGDRSYREELGALIKKLGLQQSVILPGWVQGEEKRLLLENASLTALPSRQENFAIGLVEAMAAGAPAIVSDQIDLACEIEEARAGWTCPLELQAWVNMLATAMESMTSDKLSAECAAHARAFGMRFSSDRVAGDLIGLYREITDSPARQDRFPEERKTLA